MPVSPFPAVADTTPVKLGAGRPPTRFRRANNYEVVYMANRARAGVGAIKRKVVLGATCSDAVRRRYRNCDRRPSQWCLLRLRGGGVAVRSRRAGLTRHRWWIQLLGVCFQL
jgi:hypothetical protein